MFFTLITPARHKTSEGSENTSFIVTQLELYSQLNIPEKEELLWDIIVIWGNFITEPQNYQSPSAFALLLFWSLIFPKAFSLPCMQKLHSAQQQL